MEARVAELAARGADGADAYAIRAEMIATTRDYFGVFREDAVMRTGLESSCAASRSAAAPSACATPAASSTST